MTSTAPTSEPLSTPLAQFFQTQPLEEVAGFDQSAGFDWITEMNRLSEEVSSDPTGADSPVVDVDVLIADQYSESLVGECPKDTVATGESNRKSTPEIRQEIEV